MLTAEQARELLAYDPETGALTWRVRPVVRLRADRAWNARFAGKPAGTITQGYLCLNFRGEIRVQAHRVIWLMVTGAWPEAQIDHINGDPLDNRLVNLRAATPAENQQNQKFRADNTSGYTGVIAYRDRWLAQIKAYGKYYRIGYFPTAQAAHAAYLERKAELHTFSPTPREIVMLPGKA